MMNTKNFHKFLLLPAVLILSAIFTCQSNAEKIYCKNGKVLDKEIKYRSRGVVWYTQSSGLVGIDIKQIEKIEDDDGSVSKYDYRVIGQKIQAAVKEARYADAIALCTLLLETIPDDVQVRYLRGVLSQKTGDLRKAKEDYDFLVKRNAADAAILNNLGTIYGEDKKYAEAADMFIKAVAANPEMVEIHENLAVTSLKADDHNSAMSEYEEVLRHEPNNLNALYNLGVIYMSKKEYQMARSLWERLLALNPEDADAKKALDAVRSAK